MNRIGLQAFSAIFVAAALTAGCMAGSGPGEYDIDPAAVGSQQALGSTIAGVGEDTHLSAEQIQTVVRGQFPQYKECYEGLLAQNATASGRISLAFAIDPDGAVAEIAVGSAEGELVDADFQQCMLSATQPLVFPEAQDQTTVVYPILMTPGEEE